MGLQRLIFFRRKSLRAHPVYTGEDVFVLEVTELNSDNYFDGHL